MPRLLHSSLVDWRACDFQLANNGSWSIEHDAMLFLAKFPQIRGFFTVTNRKKEAATLWQSRKCYKPHTRHSCTCTIFPTAWKVALGGVQRFRAKKQNRSGDLNEVCFVRTVQWKLDVTLRRFSNAQTDSCLCWVRRQCRHFGAPVSNIFKCLPLKFMPFRPLVSGVRAL